MTKTLLKNNREVSYPIDPVFPNRWSPRSFLEKAIPEEEIYSLFEAARWAPSANNKQPWRFILASTKEEREKFHSFILPGNLIWCEKAPVLVMALSKKTEDGKPLRTHSFDTGMACANLALEATNKGLITHFMGGIDFTLAKQTLEIPDDYEIHGVIAIGYQGEKESLPEALQLRETPNGRKEINEFVFAGSFKNK